MDWREKYRDKIVPTSDEAVRSIKSGELVVFVQAHGEARALINALIRRAPELRRIRLLSHLTFWPADYAEPEYKDSFRVISQFFGKNIRDLHNKELVEHLPLFYYEMPKLYEESWTPDTFLLMVTPPDEHGRCSLGLNSDYAVKCAEIAKKVIVQINPSLPFTHGSYFSLDNAFCIYEEDAPIPEIFMGSMGEIEKKIGENITPLIPDGATLQLGLGGVPDAVLSCLTEKKDLGIHTELFSDGVVDLCNA
ncbi:MAG TPA: hypothetical protein VN381_05295, partial [Anaerovoracaceae bacterium]|nr:hypothetical protein [Anaerovoracaceae bacterium]